MSQNVIICPTFIDQLKHLFYLMPPTDNLQSDAIHVVS